jgi:glycosyltransferase involved in cell wall biosynthesis
MTIEKKKILVFIDWYLPGYKAGGPVRSMVNMVEHLSDDTDFYIVTRNTDYMESVPYDDLSTNEWFPIESGAKVFYTTDSDMTLKQCKTLIQYQDFTAVYINGVYSWRFSIQPLIAARQLNVPTIIVAPRGMLAASAIDVKGGKKRLFLKVGKLAGLYRKVLFHATNSKEENDIHKSLGTGSRVCIADNLPRKELPGFIPMQKRKGELKLVSLARIAPEKNTLYALQRLAELPGEEGQIIFDLYGQIYNEEYWNECQEVMDQLPPHIQVRYQGTAQASEVTGILQEAHGLFMPTRGENFGHVILESLSAGRPVVISDQTPWRELEKETCGWDLSLVISDKCLVINDTEGDKDVEMLGCDDAGIDDVRMEGYDDLSKEYFNQQVSNNDNSGKSWSEVLIELINMDQETYDQWCVGARRKAEAFVTDPELLKGYEVLFGGG